MKARYQALTIAVGLTIAASACTAGHTADTKESGGTLLLVSQDKRDGVSGPQAEFRGVLLVSDDNCLQGRTPDGRIFNIEFPAGTHLNEAGDIDLGFATVPLGDEVSLGGGYSEDPELTKSLPQSCRTDTTFRVYSA